MLAMKQVQRIDSRRRIPTGVDDGGSVGSEGLFPVYILAKSIEEGRKGLEVAEQSDIAG